MGAPLIPVDLVSPGFRGVNFEQASSLLDPSWAVVANNATIDTSGRLASRRGFSNLTGTPIAATPTVKTVFQQTTEAGVFTNIVAWDGGIGTGVDAPGSNDISGAVVDADGTWWFQNFNGKVLGFQAGQKPIVRTSGNFATVVEASGTAPTSAGGVALAAYGRVWALDSDHQTIKYSALLDETNWLTGAGSIDMSNIWTNGTDQVTAIAAFNGFFVVFGHKHIIIWADTTGSQLGVDPTNLKVADVIAGVGCESQWTLQFVGDADIMFAGMHGVQSLSRVIQEKSAPLNNWTRAVHTAFLEDMVDATKNRIRSVVDPTRGLYLISFPGSRTFAFHFNRPFQSKEFSQVLVPVTTWSLAPAAWCWDDENKRLLLGGAGIVGNYAGLDTDNGTSFQFDYESPYTAIDEQVASRLKILKRLGGLIYVLSATNVTFRWDFDFQGAVRTKTVAFASSDGAEWGEGEWGEAEWSGALALRIRKFPANGQGQYIMVGLRATVVSQIAIQQLEIFSNIGAYA
jgi:hypothetical protein